MNTNNQPENINPKHIAELLTRSTQQLDDNTLAALSQARHLALERQLQSRPVFALATGRGLNWVLPHSTQQWVATIIVLVMILFSGASYWQQIQEQEHDISRLDIAILTDDLPLEVFVD